MERERIEQLRNELRGFLSGAEGKVFTFPVDCPLKERIPFIYAVIFPGFARYRFYARFFAARIAQLIDYSPLKVLIYRMLGIRIGRGVFIAADVIIDVHFPSLVAIGDYAIIGWGARLFTHEYGNGRYRLGCIDIGSGALIGAFSTIRGGVSIGEGAETPYGGVVKRDIPPGARPTSREFFQTGNSHG